MGFFKFLAASLSLLCLAQFACARPGDARPEGQASRACWIWFPENPLVEAVGQTRYFRKSFEIPGGVESAELSVAADDFCAVYVNGVLSQPSSGGSSWKDPARHDLRPLLKSGENVIAVAVGNVSSYAGLLLRCEIKAGGSSSVIRSDPAWKASKLAPEGWTAQGFDDSAWPCAASLGDASCAPWANLGLDFSPFLDSDETGIYAKWKAARSALADLRSLKLDSEPEHSAKISWRAGRPFIEVDGKLTAPFVYVCDGDPFNELLGRQCSNLVAAGARLLRARVSLKDVWQPDGRLSLNAMDDALRRLVSLNPDGYLLISFGIEAPDWWLDARPGELTGYAASKEQASKDRELRQASFASEAWRKDVKDVLAKLAAHIKGQQYGTRVIGYQAGCGVNGEWHYPGMQKVVRTLLRGRTSRLSKTCAAPSVFKLLAHFIPLAMLLALLSEGGSIVLSMAIMSITTKSSISVNFIFIALSPASPSPPGLPRRTSCFRKAAVHPEAVPHASRGDFHEHFVQALLQLHLDLELAFA